MRGREGDGFWVMRGGKGVVAYLGGLQGITQDFKMMMKQEQEKGGCC